MSGSLGATVALRMDDPGASASVQLDGWAYEKLEPQRWAEVGDVLEAEQARLSVGYTPGWADDGDPARGELLVGGRPVERTGGGVHPSALVSYRGIATTSADCVAELAALLDLARRGLVAIEMHGYTHVRPELERWARSPTAHTKVGWYRELGPEVGGLLADTAPDQRPLALGLELFREHLPDPPQVLLCPGNACAEAVVSDAFAGGFEAVVHRSLVVAPGAGRGPVGEVRNFPFDNPEALASGFPVVAAFHDRDLALNGPGWLAEKVAAWRAIGAERFVDVATLAADVSRT